MSVSSFLRLSLSLAKSEFKLRNEGSYLGILWYLLDPLLLFGLLLIIFSSITGKNILHYPLYLLLGIIMFNFFQKTTVEVSGTIRNNRFLIKSIKFSYFALVFSIVLKFLFSYLFEILVFFIFLIIFKVNIIGLLFYIPILIIFCFFVYGISLFLAALSVYFVDLDNVWLFLTRLIWFGTPIFYTIKKDILYKINLFNPLYYFITISREIVIYSKIPELWIILGMLSFSFGSLIIGLIIFNKLKSKFAELI